MKAILKIPNNNMKILMLSWRDMMHPGKGGAEIAIARECNNQNKNMGGWKNG